MLEVIEDRSQLRATIVTSQLPIAEWHDSLGDPSLADAILDRLIHNAVRIELKLRGRSLRNQADSRSVPSDDENDHDHSESHEGPTLSRKRAATMAQGARK